MTESDQIRNLIKEKLCDAYNEAGKEPEISITTYPVTQSGNDELEKAAKAKGDNGIIFIGRDVRIYGERKGLIYNVEDPYLILIYSSNKDGDTEIHELFEIARRCLFKFMKLDSDYIMDIKGFQSGLYLAWIRCKYYPHLYSGS